MTARHTDSLQYRNSYRRQIVRAALVALVICAAGFGLSRLSVSPDEARMLRVDGFPGGR